MRLIYFLSIINLFNYLDRYVLAAVLPRIREQFGLTNESGGWLVSAFVIGYVICAPVFGLLSERISKVKLMSFGVVLWSIATIATAAARTSNELFLARVFIGVGEASFATIAPAYIKARLSGVAALNRAYGIFYAAIPVGAALGYAYAGSMVGLIGWQMTFFYAGLPALLLGVLLRFAPADVRHQDQSSKSNFVTDFKLLVTQHLFWIAVLGYIFNALALNGVATFITSYGKQIGFAEHSISIWFGLILIASGFIGSILGARLCNRFSSGPGSQVNLILRFVGLSSLFAVPFLAVAFFVTNATVFLICCFLAELLVFAGTPCLNSVIMLSVPRHLESLAQGATIFCINGFGALIASPLTGYLADRYGLSFAMQLCSSSLLLGALIWIWGASRFKISSKNPAI